MTLFILKNNHVKKACIQTLNIPMTSFISKIKKGYLQTLNISITPIYTKNNHIKKHTYGSQNTWHRFFAYPLFQILKKEYLRISKYLAQTFCLSPFSNVKKAYLRISNQLAEIFCLSSFLNIKKRILTNLKIPGTDFLSFPVFKY